MQPTKQPLMATGTARPLRFAYLVDLDDCPDALLDGVFAESYTRWGGRRTLIVPAKTNGIDPAYADWLFLYDPDVMYSFVRLDDEAVASIHERYAPAHLILHWDPGLRDAGERDFRIKSPIHALSCLSVLPAFGSRSWGFGPPRQPVVLDRYLSSPRNRFLAENFGFLSECFGSGLIGGRFPSVFSCQTLISEEMLADPRLLKDANAVHLTSEAQIFETLSSLGGPLTLAQLSEFFSPCLAGVGGLTDAGTALFVGDSASDRVSFWNIHHRFEHVGFSEITALRVSTDRIDEPEFVEHLKRIIRNRGARGSFSGGNSPVTLVSCTLPVDRLEEIAARLRGGWLSVKVTAPFSHAMSLPRSIRQQTPYYRFGRFGEEFGAVGTSEFDDDRVVLPPVTPWHMKEAMPPAELRGGNWMVDLAIDRLHGNSRFGGHYWQLPRRIRLERAFGVEWEGVRHRDQRSIRVVRNGQIAIPRQVDTGRIMLTTPSDVDALVSGICNWQEWLPFDPMRRDCPIGRERIRSARLSDKGRYLVGILHRFEGLNDAFSVLMNKFWRDVLRQMGGVTQEKEAEKRAELIRTLRKRTKRLAGELSFSTDAQIDQLAREALRAGRLLGREPRFISYSALVELWARTKDDYFEAVPDEKEAADEKLEAADELDPSIQHLCQREVLFQGREWRCTACFNRNWVGINDLSQAMTCDVCRRSRPAPVSGDWQFKAHPFLIEAYRDQGTEAVIWALFTLWQSARSSFYFAPSLELWLDGGDLPDAEVDAVAVVDGQVFIIEAKSSSSIKESELGQLALVCERIRPDVLLLACMDTTTPKLQRAVEKLGRKVPAGVAVEVSFFDPAKLDDSPYLPS
jgi:hypothetical protein